MRVAVGLTFGVACTNCTNRKCEDEPSKDEPLCLPIRGEAPLEITECPNRFCGENARQAVRFANFAKRGSWPVLAGVLGQTQSCLEAFELIWAEQANYRRERKLIDTDD